MIINTLLTWSFCRTVPIQLNTMVATSLLQLSYINKFFIYYFYIFDVTHSKCASRRRPAVKMADEKYFHAEGAASFVTSKQPSCFLV